MPDSKSSSMPFLGEPPSVIQLYIRFALMSVLIGVSAVIAGVIFSLLEDYISGLYRKWINYLD